jgi:hypothetical protein
MIHRSGPSFCLEAAAAAEDNDEEDCDVAVKVPSSSASFLA